MCGLPWQASPEERERGLLQSIKDASLFEVQSVAGQGEHSVVFVVKCAHPDPVFRDKVRPQCSCTAGPPGPIVGMWGLGR